MSVLSAEMLYDDCPKCETNVFVVIYHRNEGCKMFFCHFCDVEFDPPRHSPWNGVCDLPDAYRSAFVECEIRGLSPSQYAQKGQVDTRTAKSHLTRARNRLDYTRTHVTSD